MKQITSKKLFSFCLLLIAFTYKGLNAQCIYVTDKAENGDKAQITTHLIPCKFPIYVNNGNSTLDKISFEKEVAEFKTQFPEFKHVAFLPTENAGDGNTFILIGKVEFEALSAEKQKTVNSYPEFYHLRP